MEEIRRFHPPVIYEALRKMESPYQRVQDSFHQEYETINIQLVSQISEPSTALDWKYLQFAPCLNTLIMNNDGE